MIPFAMSNSVGAEQIDISRDIRRIHLDVPTSRSVVEYKCHQRLRSDTFGVSRSRTRPTAYLPSKSTANSKPPVLKYLADLLTLHGGWP